MQIIADCNNHEGRVGFCKYWIHFLYDEYRHRYTQLDGLGEVLLRVNNLVEFTRYTLSAGLVLRVSIPG